MNPAMLLRKELAPFSTHTGTGCYKTSVDLLDSSNENAEISWGKEVPLKKKKKKQQIGIIK